jgi:hypothetical protein
LAPLATRLFWAGAALEPSRLAYAGAGGSPGWMTALQHAVRSVARTHELQQACGCPTVSSSSSDRVVLPPAAVLRQADASSAPMLAAWACAGPEELQLCLVLRRVPRLFDDSSTPRQLHQCLVDLEAAAAEYMVPGARVASDAQDEPARVRGAMLVQLLRAHTWCLWLLGVLE